MPRVILLKGMDFARDTGSGKIPAMPPRKSRRASEVVRPWKARRRGEPDTPPTVAKSYTLPVSVFLAIRKAAGEYGSQGRAVQVGSEILSRLEEAIPVKKARPSSQIRMTYKLAPRTVKLIHHLTETAYQTSGQALAACMEALKLKDLSLRKKTSSSREPKKNAG